MVAVTTRIIMDDEDLDWMLQEFALTAERARDRGLTPAEFLMGLQAYGKRFMEDYGQTVSE
ncbi:hypothetical protein [Halorussus sp. MSC15.2]|uniref:hypothetical protein n=1 Tax=Halorussus sp. MSC15.2 TaxID=2283638 RepID=UPI0013D02FD6|nr:hypothetical protein [Halorussus sp. MSC15.2]NEU57484.1 hypothetical protein [Halorussus sp. MSC15.2]